MFPKGCWMRRASVVGVAVLALLAGCGGGGGDAGDANGVTFEFRLRGKPDTEAFRVRTQSAAVIAQTRAQLAKPAAERTLFPIGPLATGNGGYNLNWGWHYTDYTLTETAIELCDGTPSYVQANLTEWLATVKSYCPWPAYVVAELP